MYIIYALLGAITGSIGAIFAKVGLQGVDSNLMTALRGIVMATVVTVAAVSFGKLTQAGIASLSTKSWFFIVVSGIAGALSWLFFYYALANGPVIAVTVIDKLSFVFTVILAMVVLAEGATLQSVLGILLVVVGTVLVAVPWNTIVSFFR